MPEKDFIRNNKFLKAADVVDLVTKEEYERRTVEIIKCYSDPIYFANSYYTIVHLERGKEIIKTYPKQTQLITHIVNNNRCIILASRQSGKCLCGASLVTVRNKKTNKVEQITLKEFHERFKSLNTNNNL